MKALTLTSKIIIIALMVAMTYSCNSKDAPNAADPPLTTLADVKLGWGKGRASNPGYLGVSSGAILTFMTVGTADAATQGKVDIVFPGDWGSSGGSLTIASPSSTGAGAAAHEYCEGWSVKNPTSLSFLPNSFDVASFNNLKTTSQLLALEKNNANYTDWLMPLGSSEGVSFLFKTSNGKKGIALIKSVIGTYGNTSSNLVLSIKMIP